MADQPKLSERRIKSGRILLLKSWRATANMFRSLSFEIPKFCALSLLLQSRHKQTCGMFVSAAPIGISDCSNLVETMPLVFVHGVNVRKNRDYDAVVEHRDAMFRQFLLSRLPEKWKPLSILNPLWGEHAARFYWNHKSLPQGNEETLGSDGVSDLETIAMFYDAEPIQELAEHPILTTARSSGLVAAIDLMWAQASRIKQSETAQEYALLANQALDFAASNPDRSWVDAARDDRQFVRQLRTQLKTWSAQRQKTGVATSSAQTEVLGSSPLWSIFEEAADRTVSTIAANASRLFLSLARRPLHKEISTFLGDVFVYLRQRDLPSDQSPILTEVLAAIDSAHMTCQERNEPLVIIAHSMGGNIVHDILTHWRTNIPVDLLVTVGTQIAVFEELKLFVQSDPQIPANGVAKAAAPPNVKKWLNIFDPNDILSFPAERIFTKVSDYAYTTGKGLFKAHVTYFNRPSLQRCLADRILEEGIN